MKTLFLIASAFALMLAGCDKPMSQEEACGLHQSKDSCVVDNACEWSDKGGCDANEP